MAAYCFICGRNSKQNRRLSFFRFPKDEERCATWLQAALDFTGRPELPKYTPDYCYKNLRVCAKHFEEAMFAGMSQSRLNLDAMPVLCSSHDAAVLASTESKEILQEDVAPNSSVCIPTTLPATLNVDNISVEGNHVLLEEAVPSSRLGSSTELSDKLDELISPKIYEYKCGECNRNFSYLRHLKYHRRKIHGECDATRPNPVNCSLCNYSDLSKLKLVAHLQQDHDIIVNFENLEFPSADVFREWKDQMEKDTNSTYVLAHGAVTVKKYDYKRTKYVCHRSGTFVSEGKGIRRLKAQGSRKINGYCPAEIDVKLFKDGKCEVKYAKTHVGHDDDLKHLTLTKAERDKLASKIASNIPFETILQEVKESESNNKKERIHLLTRKDLNNIKQKINGSNGPTSTEDNCENKCEPTITEDNCENNCELAITENNGENICEINYETDIEDNYEGKEEEQGDENEDEVITIISFAEDPNRKEVEKEQLELEKEKLKAYIGNIIEKITTPEEVDVLRKITGQIRRIFRELRNQKSANLDSLS